jgi:hypothetical protein
MKPELYQRVMVNRDFPEENLKRGDLAWLIDYVPDPEGGEEGCILEVFNIFGESISIATVPISAIETLRADQVPSVRSLAQTR